MEKLNFFSSSSKMWNIAFEERKGGRNWEREVWVWAGTGWAGEGGVGVGWDWIGWGGWSDCGLGLDGLGRKG